MSQRDISEVSTPYIIFSNNSVRMFVSLMDTTPPVPLSRQTFGSASRSPNELSGMFGVKPKTSFGRIVPFNRVQKQGEKKINSDSSMML